MWLLKRCLTILPETLMWALANEEPSLPCEACTFDIYTEQVNWPDITSCSCCSHSRLGCFFAEKWSDTLADCRNLFIAERSTLYISFWYPWLNWSRAYLCFRLGNRPWRICSQTCVMDDACWSCWRGCQDTSWYECTHTHMHKHGGMLYKQAQTHTYPHTERTNLMPESCQTLNSLSSEDSLETKIGCRWFDVWTVFFKGNSGPLGMVWPDRLLFYICSYRGSMNNGTTWKPTLPKCYPKRAFYLRRESQKLMKWY